MYADAGKTEEDRSLSQLGPWTNIASSINGFQERFSVQVWNDGGKLLEKRDNGK